MQRSNGLKTINSNSRFFNVAQQRLSDIKTSDSRKRCVKRSLRSFAMRFFKQLWYTVSIFHLPVSRSLRQRKWNTWCGAWVIAWGAAKAMLDCRYRKTQEYVES